MFRFLSLLFVCFAELIVAADIAVVTIAAGNDYQDEVRLGTENKAEYCRLHGYDFIYSTVSEDPSRHIYWSKILLMLKSLESGKYKWVVWMDADTLIMNMDIPLEDFIDDRFGLIISEDMNGLNSGVFFVKNCKLALEYLQDVYARDDCLNAVWPEQTAMDRVLKEHQFLSFAKVVPQRLFNSYPVESHTPTLKSLYQPGDFIIHFAGVAGRHGPLKKLFKKYSSLVLSDRNKITLDLFLGIYGFEMRPLHSQKNEGYMSFKQRKQFREQLMLHPHIETILEIGLNGGHSAVNFFQCCPHLKTFVSADINVHAYTKAAVEFFKRIYKEKFVFLEGDSTVTIPRFAQENLGAVFDLIYIDGGHSYQNCLSDLKNCRALAHQDSIVWLDDFFSPEIKRAVYDLEDLNFLKVKEIHHSHGRNGPRIWVEIQYIN